MQIGGQHWLLADRPEARFVASRTVSLGLGLGIVMAALLTAASGSLPQLFSQEASVLSAAAVIFPW